LQQNNGELKEQLEKTRKVASEVKRLQWKLKELQVTVKECNSDLTAAKHEVRKLVEEKDAITIDRDGFSQKLIKTTEELEAVRGTEADLRQKKLFTQRKSRRVRSCIRKIM